MVLCFGKIRSSRLFFGKSGRFCWVILVFYGLRACCQKVFLFKYPTRYYWGYPGFPSLFVPYDPTCDFYFSGHTGILVIFVQNNLANGRYTLAFFNGLFAAFMVTLLMVYQAHYSIDCVVGVICAIYAFLLINGRESRLDDRTRTVLLDPFRRWLLGIYFDTETVADLKRIEKIDQDKHKGHEY
jgi:hypothetical protein